MRTHLHSPMDQCPRWLSQDSTKNGMNRNKQRYKCETCLYNFTTNKREWGMDQDDGQRSLKLYLEGMGFSAMERVVGVSQVSMINGVKNIGKL